MNAPPAKVKAFLATVKGLLDQPENLTLSNGLLTLLRLELVQRGVVVDNNNDNNNDNNERLLGAIQSTAGRILLGTKNELPNPLLAGSAAMQGMMAELCWTNLRHDGSPSKGDSPAFDKDLMHSALARCRDVQDDRFICLLQLLNEEDLGQKSSLIVLAEGCFLRAASFQPDAPPMWKRAWDSLASRQLSADCPLLEATYPLSQLYRIAISKDNQKRASELSLSLAESWLADITPTDDLVKKFDSAFCSAYRVEDVTLLTPQERVQRAEQALSAVDDPSSFSGDDLLRFKILNLRVADTLERILIQTTASEEIKLARNRSGAGLEKQGESESSFVNRARDKVLVDSWKRQNLDIDKHADDLRDAVLELITLNLPSSVWFESALNCVRQQIERRKSRATAVALDSKKMDQHTVSSWMSTATYSLPIIHLMQLVCNEDASVTVDQHRTQMVAYLVCRAVALRRLLEEAALVTVTATWMRCGFGTSSDSEELLSCMDVIPDILAAVTEIDSTTKVNNSENMIRSTEDLTKQKLALASSSASVFAAMSSHADNNTTVSQVTEQVVKTLDSTYKGSQSEFGTIFLQLLVAWSGLRQGGAWSFCNITQARGIIRLATEALSEARRAWGRETSQMENLLLTLAKADAEGGRLVGGFPQEALELFSQALAITNEASADIDSTVAALIMSRCFCSLGRLALHGVVDKSSQDAGQDGNFSDVADRYAQLALSVLEKVSNIAELPPIYLWNASATKDSARFCTSAARQLIADAALRANRPEIARQFLEDAVRDAPTDFDAAFALGAFRLRTTFYAESIDGASTAASSKQAQVQLLKAAKLNSSKAGPFALLGLWYEESNDVSRALGCYSKALLLDPAHPVAGRGLLRLQPFEKVEHMIEAATHANSPLSGWAWRSIGQNKATIVGDDDLAVVAFLKALRCRDVEAPDEEYLGTFFSRPSTRSMPCEYGCVWAELAACYRRLGRYTSAIRAYQASYDSTGGHTSSWTLCSWAQVELELGLLDGAERKFAQVLAKEERLGIREIAAYGRGLALLSTSNRQLQDGKLGVAFETLLKATSLITETWQFDGSDQQSWSASNNKCMDGCAMKLLGDLYSLGATMPSYVFGDNEMVEGQQQLQSQLDFVRKGEAAYLAAECAYKESPMYQNDDEAVGQFLSTVICDIGANILLQSQLLCQIHEDGTTSIRELIETHPAVRECYSRAADEFRRSLQQYAVSAPTWCGLGCAVAGFDPLLAQHAFCRALQLDQLSPDAYSNLAFLYTSHNALSASGSVMDGLTQVADTPMMWVNRALILERSISLDDNDASRKNATDKIAQASDAYRAAIQVMKLPFAMLGLSLSCRVSNGSGAHGLARLEGRCYMSEFISATGSADTASRVMNGLMALENGIYFNDEASGSIPWDDELKSIQTALADMKSSSDASSCLNVSLIQQSVDILVASTTRSEHERSHQGEQATKTPLAELSLVRKIIHQPERGDLWLDYAKQLSRQRLETPTALQVAQEAAARAEQLLTQQLLQSRNVRVSASKTTSSAETVSSKAVSDASALAYWLSTQGTGQVVHHAQPTAYDLQRALMMCPNNALVRAALPVSSLTQ